MFEDIKPEWRKEGRVEKNELNVKSYISTLITKDFIDVTKDDVLNGIPYEDSSIFQQMLYHAFKKIEKLQKQLEEVK